MEHTPLIVVSDFHFGRDGYESADGKRAKVGASKNLADFLSGRSDRPNIVSNGDLFHRPHWSPAVAKSNREGFDPELSALQIGPLAEQLRTGHHVTVIDGNCDPWGSMEKMEQDPMNLIRTHLLDTHEKIDITLAGLSVVNDGVLCTHGHLAEHMRSLVLRFIGLSAKKDIASLGQHLHAILNQPQNTLEHIASTDEQGSSRFHHVVCQTLMRMERIKLPWLRALSPDRRVRRVGNETMSVAIAEAAKIFEKVNTALFGHTHQLSRSQYGSVKVLNSGSATGDLHFKPRGTFLVAEDGQNFVPYYSYHPDSPNSVIPVPEEHVQKWSSGVSPIQTPKT